MVKWLSEKSIEKMFKRKKLDEYLENSISL